MKRWLLWLPLVGFAALIALIAVTLARPGERAVPSALIGRQLPALALAPMLPGKPGFDSRAAAGGGPRVVNFFASWCVPCIAEAPQLMRLKAAGARIDGIAIRDTGADVSRFLARHGDPFAAIGSDPDSRAQIALCAAGIPETFVVDGRCVIRAQHSGNLQPSDVDAILRELEAAR